MQQSSRAAETHGVSEPPMWVEGLVLLLSVLVVLQFFLQRGVRRQLQRTEAENSAMRQRIAAAAAAAARPSSSSSVKEPSQGAPSVPTHRLRAAPGAGKTGAAAEQVVVGGAITLLSPEPEPEPELGRTEERHISQRWLCVGGLSSADIERGKQWWDGCGLGPPELEGRVVAVQGEGGSRLVGRVLRSRSARWKATVFEVDESSTGTVTEQRLVAVGSSSSGARNFQVEDGRPVLRPWRWSFDDRSRPWPPPPGWGFEGKLEQEQAAAAEQMISTLRAELGVELTLGDALLFLRANEFKAAEATAMYRLGLSWRSSFQPAALPDGGVEQLMRESLHQPPSVIHGARGPEGQRQLQCLYPHLMAGYDRDGRPVRIECMGRIRTKLLYTLTDEDALMRYHVYQNEEVARHFLPAANRLLAQRCNQAHHRYREITVVLDMTHAKLGEMMASDSRGHIMNFLGLQDYFPELLGKMLIVNAPKLLSMMWDFVRAAHTRHLQCLPWPPCAVVLSPPLAGISDAGRTYQGQNCYLSARVALVTGLTGNDSPFSAAPFPWGSASHTTRRHSRLAADRKSCPTRRSCSRTW
jgi:hypothetical protein